MKTEGHHWSVEIEGRGFGPAEVTEAVFEQLHVPCSRLHKILC